MSSAQEFGKRLRRPAKNSKAKTMRRVRSMMPDLRAALVATCDSLLSSGAVDIGEFPDNARLAKLVLVAALRRVDCYNPPKWDDAAAETIENLVNS